MFKINSVSLKNFLSIGNATQAVRLSDHGLSLILGSNNDANGGVTRNGAGKTALLQALSFGLYGQPLTKIKIDNLINNINGKGMFVVVDFEKDGVAYRVERGRRPNVLKFYKNGQELLPEEQDDNNAKGENAQTQIDISELIGMSHTMFKHICALNTYTEPFLKEGAAKQREIIEELLGVTQISARAETLKGMIGFTKDSIKIEDASNKATEAANRRINLAVKSAEMERDRWQNTHDATMIDLAEQIAATEAIDFDAEIAAFDALDAWRKRHRVLVSDKQFVERDVTQLQRDRTSLNGRLAAAQTIIQGTAGRAAVDRLERDLVRALANSDALQADIVTATAERDRVMGLLANPGEQECATCGQALAGTDHLAAVIARLERDLAARDKAVVSKEADHARMMEEIEEARSEIAVRIEESEQAALDAAVVVEEITQSLTALDTALVEKAGHLTALADELNTLGEQPQPLFESRDEIYTVKHARDILATDLAREAAAENPFEGQIAGLQQTLQEIDLTAMNELTDTLLHQEYVLKMLTNKDSFIRRKIVEQNLVHLNQRLNGYLNKLGLPHEIRFKSDLDVDIVLLGRSMDFAQLSRGEGNRLIMATSWAFRDVWESLNHSVNLIWIDELLDSGLDGAGAESGLQILKAMGRAGRNVFLVSHRDELVGRIDRILRVSKENGFTSISEEV
jgi:DNA repair exonuclease SbcCD ATPase subunit